MSKQAKCHWKNHEICHRFRKFGSMVICKGLLPETKIVGLDEPYLRTPKIYLDINGPKPQ